VMGAIFMKLGRAPDTIVIFIAYKLMRQKYVFLGKLFVTLPIILMNTDYKSLNI
jgi:hypothetical protein